jgi:putative endonuclease
MFYVYLLHSAADSGLYIGFSTDLRRRLTEHKKGASQATSHRGPWNLIYYEAYVEQADALGRERYLKSGGGRKFLWRSSETILLNTLYAPREAKLRHARRSLLHGSRSAMR